MSLPVLLVLTMAALAAGYALYGRFIARQYRLDDAVPTPAHRLKDGSDFVPTKPFYLFGQHFSAIAAAGPIVGPILACDQFGWLPCILWITFGVIFIGAVHDISSLVASVRHNARSVAEIVRQNLSPRAWVCIMAFIWIALLYVIVAFTDVTAGSFLGKIEELEGVRVDFNRGGAVAFAAIAYLGVAVLMGLIQKKWNPPLWLITIIFVPATLAVVWLGTKCSTVFAIEGVNAQKTWGALILAYCFIASLLPMWLLLQPRGYLGGFVLYIVLVVGVIGIFFGGHAIQQAAFKGFAATDAKGNLVAFGSLFPFLFVTIACGACSGFHGLVCSGTTSKQIDRESDCKSVGYGAMLLEALVALIALTTMMILVKRTAGPGTVYGQGIGMYLTVLIGKENLLFAIVFGTMAFSTFVFDTLDVSTRLGRYVFQELFDWKGKVPALIGTLLTVGVPLFFILTAAPPKPGTPPAYMAFWTLFGTSNQLLAALTLLGITVWLKRSGRACWFVFLPMVFVMAITLWALVQQLAGAVRNWRGPDGALQTTVAANGVTCGVLLVLAAMLVVEAVRAVRRPGAGVA